MVEIVNNDVVRKYLNWSSTLHKALHCVVTGLLVISGTAACSANSNESVVGITNVKSGLFCMSKYEKDGRYTSDPHVCFETENIKVTGQGRCIFDGKTKPCTWYGYEFDYDNSSETPIILTCEFSLDSNSIVGNPEGVLDDNISSYDVSLDPGEGYFSNPQYSLYRTSFGENPRQITTACHIDGKQVFKVKYNIHMPTQP